MTNEKTYQTITNEELQEVLHLHRLWVLHDIKGARANLRNADLRGVNLFGADLHGADLRGADLRGAAISPLFCAQLTIVPEVGSFVGWKKADGEAIIKLEIPADAKRSNATGRKCRCSKAKVLSIEHDGIFIETVKSKYDCNFIYRVGETVEVEDFCDDRWVECAAGIHFFITREEAENY